VKTNLLCFYNFLVNSMESGNQTDVIYTAFRKAFDSVNHSVISAQLKIYGLSDHLLTWISSYLVNRVQQVKINGFLSNKIPVPYWCSPRGHLSPLLFALFILDIDACFKYCKYHMFADDLKIYANVVTIYDHYKIQVDLNRF